MIEADRNLSGRLTTTAGEKLFINAKIKPPEQLMVLTVAKNYLDAALEQIIFQDIKLHPQKHEIHARGVIIFTPDLSY